MGGMKDSATVAANMAVLHRGVGGAPLQVSEILSDKTRFASSKLRNFKLAATRSDGNTPDPCLL